MGACICNPIVAAQAYSTISADSLLSFEMSSTGVNRSGRGKGFHGKLHAMLVSSATQHTTAVGATGQDPVHPELVLTLVIASGRQKRISWVMLRTQKTPWTNDPECNTFLVTES